MKMRQAGVTLIEVLVALLIMCIGLLGAAAIQLNALKFTDSSSISSQASFVAYDMMDRIRANSTNVSQYALANLAAAPSQGNLSNAITQDRFDFATNVTAIGGSAASIVVNGFVVTITIAWDDTRANRAVTMSTTSDAGNDARTFTLTSRVAADAVTQ